jgi:peptidoglycan hydrolase FlgJ
MPININQQFEQASIYSDLGSLNAIREQGLTDEHGAVKKAAKEFEAFFMNMMLKSMRQSAEVIGENSLTGSEAEKMFVGMMDEQMSADLSQQGHLGIADLMMSQLERQYKTRLKGESDSTFENERVKLYPNKQEVIEAKVNVTNIIVPKMDVENKLSVKAKEEVNVKVEGYAEIQAKIQTEKPEKKSLFNEVADFVNGLLPHAKKAAEVLNVDPRVLIAQAALETGWGKFIMHDKSGEPGFNLFGIKAGREWGGESIKISTLEVENQQFKKVNASFRKYGGFSESFDDYVSFLKQNPRYKKVIDSAGDANVYVKELQAAGYATDPNYAKKIMRIFKYNDLKNIDVNIK